MVDGDYQLQSGEPIWLPEIELAIGRERGTYLGITREWLYWYDEQGKRSKIPEEVIEEEHQRIEEIEALLKQYQERFGDLSE